MELIGEGTALGGNANEHNKTFQHKLTSTWVVRTNEHLPQ